VLGLCAFGTAVKIGENPRHRPQCLGQRCVGVHKTISKFLGWAVSVFVDCEDDIQAALDKLRKQIFFTGYSLN
jgi:hypothetical protein